MYDIFGKYGGIRQIRMYVDAHVLFAVGIPLRGYMYAMLRIDIWIDTI